MTSEGQIYVWTKQLLRSGDWHLLASDPPRGTDAPRLEIKQPGGAQSLTKNKNAIINDLVYCKGETLALIECKDSSEKISMDIKKLGRLTNDQSWRDSIVSAMSDRSLFGREGTPSVDAVRGGSALVPVLAYPGNPSPELPEFVQIAFDGGNQNIVVGSEISQRVRSQINKLQQTGSNSPCSG